MRVTASRAARTAEDFDTNDALFTKKLTTPHALLIVALSAHK